MLHRDRRGERLREGLRVVDNELVQQRFGVDPGEPLDEVQRLARPERADDRIEAPGLVRVVPALDHQRVAIPPAA